MESFYEPHQAFIQHILTTSSIKTSPLCLTLACINYGQSGALNRGSLILQCTINMLSYPRSHVLTQPIWTFQEYLHSKNYIHGNVRARSVLVGRDLSVKLWGLGSAYHRQMSAGSIRDVEDMEMRKWHAPEVLGRQPLQPSSDM